MAEWQYSNSYLVGPLITFTSAISFVMGKPSTVQNLWNPEEFYPAPLIAALFCIFACASTIKKRVATRPSDLRELGTSWKRSLIVGYILVIGISTACQVTIWKWNWHPRGSYSLFVISNLVMMMVYVSFVTNIAEQCVFIYRWTLVMPLSILASTAYISTFIPSEEPGDRWLFNLYYNVVTAISIKDLYAVLVNDIRVHIHWEKEYNKLNYNISHQGDEVNQSEYSSSDEDWEKVGEDDCDETLDNCDN